MATTTNFGWETPDDTDLVKDGAAAIRTALGGVDTSFVDLKGGTTGQILSKATNTDMDFNWISPNPGDITGITATSPLTGGGTSGDVTVGIQASSTTQSGAVQLEDSTASTSTTKAATPNSVKSAYDLANAAIPKSLVDAKADIITATADNTPARLAVGANNTVLTADSSTATGLKWATPSGGGKVLQVVYASYDTDTSSTSASFADTGLSATITPTLSTSKVLVLVEQNGLRKEGNTWHDIKLLRGATDILQFAELASSTATTTRNNIGGVGASYLDSPATTSATTYKTQFASGNGATVYVQNGLSASTITLLEIGA